MRASLRACGSACLDVRVGVSEGGCACMWVRVRVGVCVSVLVRVYVCFF